MTNAEEHKKNNSTFLLTYFIKERRILKNSGKFVFFFLNLIIVQFIITYIVSKYVFQENEEYTFNIACLYFIFFFIFLFISNVHFLLTFLIKFIFFSLCRTVMLLLLYVDQNVAYMCRRFFF